MRIPGTPSQKSSSIEFFTASSGALSARVREGGRVRHLHSTVEPESESRHWSDVEIWGEILVLAGVGLGYHLANLCRSKTRPRVIIAIDKYQECLESAQTLLESWTDALFCISGDVNSFRQSICEHTQRGSVQILKHPASYTCDPSYYDSILASLLPPTKQRTQASIQRCMLLHGSHFLQTELLHALQQEMGTEPALFSYNKYTTAPQYESALSRCIDAQSPEFILSVNMQGIDGNGYLVQTAKRRGIPLVVWFVDDPRPMLLPYERQLGEGIIALTWEKAYCARLRQHGFSRVEYLPLATDPGLIPPPNYGIPRTSLGFVGSALGEEYLEAIRRKFMWSDNLRPLVEEAAKRLLDSPESPIDRIIESVSADTGISLPFADRRNLTWLSSYVIHSASRLKRTNIIESLIPLGVETYGDPEGWRELMNSRIRVHPDVDYRTGIWDVYRSVTVNINITSAQMPTAVNQRVFDVPAAGGFLLTDYQESLNELFECEKELAIYRTREELLDKVRFFSVKESDRIALIDAARNRVLSEHTYQHRVRRILQVLRV